ncbi:MAG: glycosyltransferase family 2 protein [Gloeotrichia echinulata HAB0833]
MTEKNKVYIILVNWNGWADTIECLESVFRNDYPNYCVIVCDNDSSNGSLDYIKAWAEGKIDIFLPKSHTFHSLSFPPISKPVSYVQYDRVQAEAGGSKENADANLILIQTGANLGFGGGNNVGLRYALLQSDCGYVWLLNNDTVIDNTAIKKMVEASNNGLSMTGSILKFYYQPDKVQAYGGGYFSSFTSRVVSETKIFPKKLDFINGASLMMSRAVIQKVGLFDSNIFMYFEENEYCIRAQKQGIQMKCADTVVYHKIGACSNDSRVYTSWLNVYQNKIYVMKKHFGYSFWLFFFTTSLFFNLIHPKMSQPKKHAVLGIILKLPRLLTASFD